MIRTLSAACHPVPKLCEAQSILSNALLPAADGAKVVQRSGCGPRLVYVMGGGGDAGENPSAMERLTITYGQATCEEAWQRSRSLSER